ncbi:MAG: SCO family protein, partial [Phycisphaerales bacterium]|nr:SCO family protein [Phycisphaerales bacterium]
PEAQARDSTACLPRLRFGLVVLVSLLLASCTREASDPDPTSPDPGYESFAVTDFALTDQNGEPADATILDGRYTVLDFFFTNCPIYCPAMSQVMLHVQRETEGSGVRFLSISVDGEHDTPEVIAAYAEELGADPDRWRFLTGDPEHVRSIAEGQLYLGITYDPTRPVTLGDGSSMDFIDHPTRLVLIGPDRRVLGTYSYARKDEVDLLIERIRRLHTP